MDGYFNKWKMWFPWLLVFCLIGFNIYYFIYRKNVTPMFYYHKFFHGLKDPVMGLVEYQDLREEYRQLNKGIHDQSVIVFLGDSITRRFKLDEYFPDIRIYNRGICRQWRRCCRIGRRRRVGRYGRDGWGRRNGESRFWRLGWCRRGLIP